MYQDGNKIQLVALCFEAEIVGGELRLSCETTEYGYFSYQEIQELDLLLNHAQRIKDAYSRERRRRLLLGNGSLTGLTQTSFGKKASASDSVSETVKREVAEARGPRRTDACCVSPILDRKI